MRPLMNTKVFPYQFEPVAIQPAVEETLQQPENETGESALTDRLLNTDWYWCGCGNCGVLETMEERICCTECSKVWKLVETCRDDPASTQQIRCITGHPSFTAVCLNTDVLLTAYNQYKQEHGRLQKTLEQKLRYIAYRQLVRWAHGVMGRKIVPLPLCAVRRIRSEFESESSKGFKWPDLNWAIRTSVKLGY